MDRQTAISKYEACCKKAGVNCFLLSQTAADKKDIFFCENGCFYFRGIKTPYNLQNIRSIRYYADELEGQESFVSIRFVNKDRLTLYANGECSLRAGNVCPENEEVAAYLCALSPICRYSVKDAAFKIKECLEALCIMDWVVSADEDEISDLGFDANGDILLFNEPIPYNVADIALIRCSGPERAYTNEAVYICFKNGERLELTAFGECAALICENGEEKYLSGAKKVVEKFARPCLYY